MWILSQNKKWLANLDRTDTMEIRESLDGTKCCIYADGTILGRYKSIGHAEQAIQQIENEIMNFGHDRCHIFHMSADREDKEGRWSRSS